MLILNSFCLFLLKYLFTFFSLLYSSIVDLQYYASFGYIAKCIQQSITKCIAKQVQQSFSIQQSHIFSPDYFPLSVQFGSVAQSCLTLCDPRNHSTPGLPVHHQLPEFTQTHVHRVGDAIQSSHPLLSPSPPAPNPSQHQGLFQ